jgi:hypothetical protein
MNGKDGGRKWTWYILRQRCINPGRRAAWATKFNTVASNICGFWVHNLLQITFLAPIILRWLLDFLKISRPLFRAAESGFGPQRNHFSGSQQGRTCWISKHVQHIRTLGSVADRRAPVICTDFPSPPYRRHCPFYGTIPATAWRHWIK